MLLPVIRLIYEFHRLGPLNESPVSVKFINC